jgi:asparagine synthase (glutamine-hydrolysing)
MIGIFALAGFAAEELARLARGIAADMATHAGWQSDVWAGNSAAGGRVGPVRTDTIWVDNDGSRRAWLDGYALALNAPLGAADRLVGAAELAQSLLARGPKALRGYYGDFLLLVVDERERRLLVCTDRFGVRTAYRHVRGGRLAISSELGPLLRRGVIPSLLDRPYVAALLRFNKCRLLDRTLFADVYVLPPGCVQQYDLDMVGEPIEERYYEHVFGDEERTPEEWIEEIEPALRLAVATALKCAGGRASLALSGGLDSRLVLAATNKAERAHLLTLTCGLPQADEVSIAAQVAAVAGTSHCNVDLGPRDYLEHSTASVRRNEEFDIFVQGAQAVLQGRAAERTSGLLTGWDVDVPLRGTYLDASTRSLANNEDVPQIIDGKWGLFGRDALASLLQPTFHREVADAPEQWLRDALTQLPADTALRRYLQFVFRYEKRRLLMLRNRMIRFELDSVLPLYDARLQQIMAKIPEHLKAGNRLFALLLRCVSGKLAEIPYTETGLPANVPVEFWRRGARLEAQREALYRDIYTACGIRIPYTRYYSNFDEWLVSDADWRRFADELLISENSRLAREFVRPEALRTLLYEHRNGVRSHHARLIHLISLELYIREYFD